MERRRLRPELAKRLANLRVQTAGEPAKAHFQTREPARTGSTSEGMTAAKKTNCGTFPHWASAECCNALSGALLPSTERIELFLYLNVSAL